MAPPTPGDLFERSYEVDGQTVEFLAEVAIDGPTLHLRDVAIFPAGADRASPGAAALLRVLRSELLAELRSFGFTAVRVTGTRLSGAAAGRSVDIVIQLEESQP